MLCKPAAPEAKTLPHQLHNQLLGRSLRRSFDGNSASYQPSTGNKQGIYCLLAFTGANCAQFDFSPFSFHSVNKETTHKKPDTGQTVSCWHHSDLGIILPLWNAEQACRLLVQFWKEVGEAKAKQDALQWNALKKTKYFNQYLNSSNVGQNLLISLLTTEASTKKKKKIGLIYIDMKKCRAPLQIKRHLTHSVTMFLLYYCILSRL